MPGERERELSREVAKVRVTKGLGEGDDDEDGRYGIRCSASVEGKWRASRVGADMLKRC